MKSDQQVLTGRFIKALSYCDKLHSEQTRKGKSVPYISHLLSVCALVLEDGGNENEAIAALLHDAIEDQPEKTNPSEIKRRFGSAVLQMVLQCTDTPADFKGGEKPPWRERKQKYLDRVRKSDSHTNRIVLADKPHNARDLLADYDREGSAVWQRFNAPKKYQIWFFSSLVSAFKKSGQSGPMLKEFERVVEKLKKI